MTETMTFAGVTADKFDEAVALLTGDGVAVPGDYGDIESRGLQVRYSYDRAHGRLTVGLLKKPFLVPLSLLKAKVRSALAGRGITEVT